MQLKEGHISSGAVLGALRPVVPLQIPLSCDSEDPHNFWALRNDDFQKWVEENSPKPIFLCHKDISHAESIAYYTADRLQKSGHNVIYFSFTHQSGSEHLFDFIHTVLRWIIENCCSTVQISLLHRFLEAIHKHKPSGPQALGIDTMKAVPRARNIQRLIEGASGLTQLSALDSTLGEWIKENNLCVIIHGMEDVGANATYFFREIINMQVRRHVRTMFTGRSDSFFEWKDSIMIDYSTLING